MSKSKAYIWASSSAVSGAAFVLIVLSILGTPVPAPGEIEQRAAELQQMRQSR